METELKRIKKTEALLAIPEPLSKISVDLAKAARSELSYSAYDTHLNTKVVDRARRQAWNRIIKGLSSIGIDLLDWRLIEKYAEEMKQDKTKQTGHRWLWDYTALNYYYSPIPEFAIERALQVKKKIHQMRLSEPEFAVYELKQERNVADPFMTFKVKETGEWRFWLDVWDEPKFEGRKLV